MDIPITDQQEIHCLSQAIFFEARGEPTEGKEVVGFVIKNRVLNQRYPENFCSVIDQKGQFTYKRNDQLYERSEKQRKITERIAREVYYSDENPIPDNVLFFTSRSINPFRNNDKIHPYGIIGNHRFYILHD